MADPTPILDLIDGFRRSKTLFAAVKLGVFDGARPRAAALERLLEACVSLGLLERRNGEFVNTPLADEYLRSTSPRTLAGYIRWADAVHYPLWIFLEDAVREGTARWRQTSGLAPAKRWLAQKWRQVRERALGRGGPGEFVAAMHGMGMIGSRDVAGAFDLARFRRFVDLGGSSGHLALALRERYPQMEVTDFDLPPVIRVARQFVGDQVTLVPGDFMKDPLPPADLYALGKVLHNLSDPAVSFLLDRVFAALPQGGGLLVVERWLDEDRNGPAHVHMASLNMLVATSGRERTLSEYRALLEKTGFAEVRATRIHAPVDAILALKE
jgi:acetylserotonin N-methyltransferase